MLDEYIENTINEAYEYMHNDTQKALKIFDEIIEIEPENIDAINGKGSTLMKLHKLDEAEAYFNQSLSISENSSAFLNKGIIYKQRNEFEKALQHYEKAYEINPNLKDIIIILKNEVNQDNYLNKLTNESNELIKKGLKFKNEKKYFDSIKILIRAIEVDPTCESKVNELINEIRIKLEKEFEYENCNFNKNNKIDRVKIQALKTINNPQKAIKLINLILKLDESDLNMLNHKGGILFICSEYQKAIECFDECLNENNDYYWALFNKALVLRYLDKLPESFKNFDELLKIPQFHDKVKPYHLELLDKLNTDS